MTELRVIISKNLRKYRKQAKMSQIELAEKIGVRSSAISNWENGQNSIDIDLLFKVCKVLGVSINDMAEIENDSGTGTNKDYLMTDDDSIVIETYRKLPASERAHLLAYAEFLYNQTASAEKPQQKH